jgi:tetratricopeptide (TPR) repeat protein
LEQLADTVPIGQMPPASLYLLGHTLSDVSDFSANDKIMDLLRRAQHEYPSDLWINDTLAYYSAHICKPPRLDDALRFYTVVLALRPGFAPVHRSVADVLRAKGALQEALVEYTKVIELDPNNRSGWLSRGWLYHNSLRSPDKAVADYTRVIALDPKEIQALIDRAESYKALGQKDKALADYSKVTEREPDAPWDWFNRGTAHLALHQYDRAVAAFSKGIKLEPEISDYWSGRGSAYLELRQYDKALDDFSKVIELEPKSVSALQERGWCYFHHLKQYDKALADFNRAIKLEPKNASVWVARAKAYSLLDQHREALDDLTRAIDLDTKNVSAWRERAGVYRKLRQYDKARDDFSKVIEIAPKDPNAWFNRAGVNNQLGRYAETLADYQKLLELDKDSAIAHNNLAWLLATCPDVKYRDPARAVALAKKAVELARKEGASWNTLGVAHYRAGDWKAAVEALTKSMELRKGGDSFDWFFLAMAHWHLGEKDKARKWFDQAAQWMDKNAPHDEELRRFRTEAAELLGIKKKK